MKSGRWQAALPMACDQRPHMLAGYLVALPTAHLLTILQHTSLPPSKMLGTPSETNYGTPPQVPKLPKLPVFFPELTAETPNQMNFR